MKETKPTPTCDICNRQFWTVQAMLSHKRNVHKPTEKIQWFVLINYGYDGDFLGAHDTEEEAHKAYTAEHDSYTQPLAIIKGTVIEGKLE